MKRYNIRVFDVTT